MVRSPDVDDSTTSEHPAADIDTMVVDPDDVIGIMKRNYRDQNEQRTHVLRITPPFNGEKTATTHVSQDYTYYPSDITTPIHIGAPGLIVGHTAGRRHPDFERHYLHPDINQVRSEFRSQYDLFDDKTGELLKIEGHEEREEKWEEWLEVHMETWEGHVRHVLKSTNKIVLTSQCPDVKETTVEVRFESDDE